MGGSYSIRFSYYDGAFYSYLFLTLCSMLVMVYSFFIQSVSAFQEKGETTKKEHGHARVKYQLSITKFQFPSASLLIPKVIQCSRISCRQGPIGRKYRDTSKRMK